MGQMSLQQLRGLVPQVPLELRALLAKVAEGFTSAMRHARNQVALFAESVALFDGTPSSAGRITETFQPHPPLLVIREPGTPIDWIVQAIRTAAPTRGKTVVFRPENSRVGGQTTTDHDNTSPIRRADVTSTEEYLREADESILVAPRLSDLSMADQRILHTALQEGFVYAYGNEEQFQWPPNIVFVAAESSGALEDMRQQGCLDEDLWRDLCVFPCVLIPPLQDRPKEIPFLIQRALLVRGSKWGTVDLSIQTNFNEKALFVMTNYEWPRNEEQLASVLDRLLLTRLWQDPSYQLREHDVEAALDFHGPVVVIRTEAGPSAPARPPEGEPWSWGTDFPEGDLDGAVERLRRRAAEEALRQTDGKKKPAARLLGIDRHTLDRILKGP